MEPNAAKTGRRQHALLQVLANNKGNPRTLILIEPLWGIPYNLITPFATLYMYTLGVTDVQIGLILSVTMVVQVIIAFLGGILTDKLGRKFTTMLGDFFGWAIACLVWAVSQNFWMFLVAAVLNCFEQVNQTAWFCLLIEDANPGDLVEIYTWVTIGGLVAVFFAPLSGLFVNAYSIVPVVRVLYFLFALTMVAKTLITFRFCHETGQGRIRREQTRGVSVLQMLGDYRQLIPSLLRSPGLVKAMAVSVILYITTMINNSFFSLYVTQRLGLSENFLALFPILNASVMLIFMVGLQHRLHFERFRMPLWIGLTLYGARRTRADSCTIGQFSCDSSVCISYRRGRRTGEPAQGCTAPAESGCTGTGPDERPDHCFHGGALLPLRLSGGAAFQPGPSYALRVQLSAVRCRHAGGGPFREPQVTKQPE